MKRIEKFFKNEKGGIPTIITIIATTIVAMGLFSYSILNQSTQVKEASDKAILEQQKVSIMLENQDAVSGKMVLSYIDRLGDDNCRLQDSTNQPLTIAQINEAAIFDMDPTYDENGELISAIFTRVNLGS